MEETDARCKNQDCMATCAEMLKVDVALLNQCLTKRKIARAGSKSVTYAYYSIVKATDARDGTAKALYGKLFDWLIIKINQALKGLVADFEKSGKEKLTTIGVLDIFGFESFATNSFEQVRAGCVGVGWWPAGCASARPRSAPAHRLLPLSSSPPTPRSCASTTAMRSCSSTSTSTSSSWSRRSTRQRASPSTCEGRARGQGRGRAHRRAWAALG